MIRTPLILMLLSISLSVKCQNPVGAWSDHLSYFTAKRVAVSQGKVYASTGSSVIVFDRRYNELSKITRVQGLTETGISTIAFSSEQNALIIAYSSTNIDIVKSSLVYNVPDIKRKYIPGNKEIFRIKTRGKYAYLSCSFGIVVVDIAKNEIYDTWQPGPGSETTEVYDMTFLDNIIYAATSDGVFYADINSAGLSYYENWTREERLPSPGAVYNGIISAGGKLYANRFEKFSDGDSVYVIDSSVSLFMFQSGIFNRSFDSYNNGFTVTSRNRIQIFSSEGLLVRTVESYNPGIPDINHSVADGNDIWIADNSKGLIHGTGMSSYEQLNLPGPYTNNVISISNALGKTYITGGAVDNAWNNQWRDLQIFINDNNSWVSELSYELKDAMRVFPDPSDRNHFWVSTWGMGLLEYRDNSIVNKYDDSNSPLQTIIPGKPYTRICGLALDNDRNLWITHTGMPGSIKVLKQDGSWMTYPHTIEAPTIGDIIIASNGYKWIVLPRGFGIFVLDDNNTVDNFSDDRFKQLLIRDNDNKIISNVYSIAEDLDGNIWVGTDQGPAIYYNPRQIFDDDAKAYRVKVPRNDGTGLADYMLGTEIITSIAVDGANRKWLGTFSSGAYLLSADGTSKLLNYNEENSPILSNTVVSLDIDDITGAIWFGTAKGVISVRGDATLGGENFKNVYAFPNPVRETFQGNVTITGLMRNTQVRITDVSGNLVYETVSDGGQAIWDLRTYNGKRASTGVYLVFCASEDGSESCVIKILLVR